MDEVFLTINEARYDWWRSADQAGHLLNILVPRRRGTKAAKGFCRKRLKGLIDVPQVIITDTVNGCGVTKREMLPDLEHLPYRCLNNHAKNSHQPMRQRGSYMQRFKAPGHAQRFLNRAGSASWAPDA